jgi:hypothetical protein
LVTLVSCTRVSRPGRYGRGARRHVGRRAHLRYRIRLVLIRSMYAG